MQPHVVHTQAHRLAHGGRIHWFLLVGCSAAAVHWGMVVALVRHGGWHPLAANVAGWLTAFGVSFLGHHARTFRGHTTPVRAAALRFFGLSAFGFIINEGAYAVLLPWCGPHYDLVLAGVILAVAVITYQVGRRWAFAGTAP